MYMNGRTTRKERTENGAIDLSQTGAELKFKIDPVSGELFDRTLETCREAIRLGIQ